MKTNSPSVFPKLFTLIVFALGFFLVQAQDKKPEKKVVIIKKTIDINGNEQVEKIIKTGEEAEEFDFDELEMDLELNELMENGRFEFDIEIDEDGDEELRKIIIDGDEMDFEAFENDEEFSLMLEELNDLDIDIARLKREVQDHTNHIFQMRNKGKAFLGVRTNDLDENGRLLIVHVIKGSAADKAGLKTGDVLLKVSDKPVATHEELIEIIRSQKPDDQITIAYERDGKTATTTATLKEKERDNYYLKNEAFHRGAELESIQRGPHHRGMRGPKGPRLGVQIEDMEDGTGVLLTHVDKESPAANAGLRNGDIIQKLNDQKIVSIKELKDQINSLKAGDVVNVEYRREGKVAKKEVTLEEGHAQRQRWEHRMTKKRKQDSGKKKVKIRIKTDSNGLGLIEAASDTREIDFERIEVFPNPTGNYINLDFSTSLVGGPLKISLADLAGKEVFTEEIDDFSGSYKNKLNIQNNAGGIYILSIEQNGKIWTERIAVSSR